MTNFRSGLFSSDQIRCGPISKWPIFEVTLSPNWPIFEVAHFRSGPFSKWSIFEVTLSPKWPIFEVDHFRSGPFSKRLFLPSDLFSSLLIFQVTFSPKWPLFKLTHLQFFTFRRIWIIWRNFLIWNFKSDERSTMAVFCTMMVLTAALVFKLDRLIKNGHVEPLGRARHQIPR